jgi:pyrroloquinoline quinone biosynthesis protein B
VIPRLVPHRGPWSETVGLEIRGPRKRALYVPDLDDFTPDHDPLDWIADVDRLYIDATFFSDDEIPWRDAAQVPHPRVEATLRRFSGLPPSERAKVRFIHLNHTNPLLDPTSPVARRLLDEGYVLAADGERMAL